MACQPPGEEDHDMADQKMREGDTLTMEAKVGEEVTEHEKARWRTGGLV